MIQCKGLDTASNARFSIRMDTFQSAPKKSITNASVPSSVPLHPESPGLAFHIFHALYQGHFTCQIDGSRSNKGNLGTVSWRWSPVNSSVGMKPKKLDFPNIELPRSSAFVAQQVLQQVQFLI